MHPSMSRHILIGLQFIQTIINVTSTMLESSLIIVLLVEVIVAVEESVWVRVPISHSVMNKTRSMSPSAEIFTIVEQVPNSVTLQFRISDVSDNITVRLLYERVPYHYQAEIGVLQTPVVETFNMTSSTQNFTIRFIPRGKFIICAELLKKNKTIVKLLDSSVEDEEADNNTIAVKCVETVIKRREGKSNINSKIF